MRLPTPSSTRVGKIWVKIQGRNIDWITRYLANTHRRQIMTLPTLESQESEQLKFSESLTSQTSPKHQA